MLFFDENMIIYFSLLLFKYFIKKYRKEKKSGKVFQIERKQHLCKN